VGTNGLVRDEMPYEVFFTLEDFQLVLALGRGDLIDRLNFKGVYGDSMLGNNEAQQVAYNEGKDTFKWVESDVVYLTTFKDDP